MKTEARENMSKPSVQLCTRNVLDVKQRGFNLRRAVTQHLYQRGGSGLSANQRRPINRFAAQNRIYPVLFCSPAINREAVTARCEPMFVTTETA